MKKNQNVSSKTNVSTYDFFIRHLNDEDKENARGILRAFTALFEPTRFTRQENKVLLIRELGKFLNDTSLFHLPIFAKFPFRAAGDVIYFMSAFPNVARGLDICEEYVVLQEILRNHETRYSAESLCRLRLASQGIKLTKSQDEQLISAPDSFNADLFCAGIFTELPDSYSYLMN